MNPFVELRDSSPLLDAAAPAAPQALGLVTNDEDLVQRVGVVASRANVRFVVASDPIGAREMLRSTEFVARLLDMRAVCAVPASGLETTALLDVEEDLVLVVGERRDGSPLRLFVYPRHALGRLLLDVAATLESALTRDDATSRIVGHSPEIRLVRDQVRSIARYRDVPVLVLGETGTGKELVAEAIHASGGGAADRPFIAINCAAIPEALFESELFGHEAGAYTGARGVRVGLLEAAAGGTLFLDEVGEMPSSLQPKLLRALESRTFRRVGSNKDIRLAARIVSATNRMAWGDVDRSMRADLRYRLAGFVIVLPALRERTGDIPLLAKRFLGAFIERHRVPPMVFSEEATTALRAHAWPGNVRELRAVVEHAAIVATTHVIEVGDLMAALSHRPARTASRPPPASAATPAPERLALPAASTPTSDPASSAPRDALAALGAGTSLRDIERDLILRTFESTNRNVSRAAEKLGIPRSTLRDKLTRMLRRE